MFDIKTGISYGQRGSAISYQLTVTLLRAWISHHKCFSAGGVWSFFFREVHSCSAAPQWHYYMHCFHYLYRLSLQSSLSLSLPLPGTIPLHPPPHLSFKLWNPPSERKNSYVRPPTPYCSLRFSVLFFRQREREAALRYLTHIWNDTLFLVFIVRLPQALRCGNTFATVIFST